MKKTILFFMVMTTAIFAGHDVDFEPGEGLDRLQRYGINGSVEGLFGEPMPAQWFMTPEAAETARDSFFAQMSPITDTDEKTSLLLINEDSEVTNNIIIEARNRNSSFITKYLVQIPSGEERHISMESLANHGLVRLNLYAASPFAAFKLSQDRQVSEAITVEEPQRPLDLPTATTTKVDNCFTTGKVAIRITSETGSSVNAWAEAYTDNSNSPVYRNYLAVYYPSSSAIYHYPLKSGWGTRCDHSVNHLYTGRSSDSLYGDHTWYYVKDVLLNYGVSRFVKCRNASVCGNGSWTYTRR